MPAWLIRHDGSVGRCFATARLIRKRLRTAHGVLTHHFQPRVDRRVDIDMLGLPIAAEEFMRRSGS
ncbi:hypothetical protein BI294_23985 [Mycobacterium avium subsp. hominissuis]|nr:hypothetical protein BI294_23985 [Mycobacterium avium subsp. hominissuis]PBJ57519.1 hypothetical protein BB736_20045 [Mycobacterium avium subsp. hominissuis]